MLPLSKVARLKERKKNKSKRSAPTTKLLIRHLRHFGARETVKGSESVECTENLLILQVCLASACEIFRRYFYSHVVGDVSGQSNLESGSDFDINNRFQSTVSCIAGKCSTTSLLWKLHFIVITCLDFSVQLRT